MRFVFLLIIQLAESLRLSRRDQTWKTAEILILRCQFAVVQRRPRPKLNWADRALLAALLAGDRVVVAVATGDQFDIGLLRSADLLLVSGTVKADIDEPAVPHGKSPSADWENSDEEEVPSE